MLLMYLNNFVSTRNNVSSLLFQFSSVQSLSRVRLFATPWTAARQASLSMGCVSILDLSAMLAGLREAESAAPTS